MLGFLDYDSPSLEADTIILSMFYCQLRLRILSWVDVKFNVHQSAESQEIIKRWSEAESFTIYVNHAYTSEKILCMPKFFVTFSSSFFGWTFFLL